jgi:hypothetical protein
VGAVSACQLYGQLVAHAGALLRYLAQSSLPAFLPVITPRPHAAWPQKSDRKWVGQGTAISSVIIPWTPGHRKEA